MYIVRNNRYTEDPGKKLGSGSEGAVYPFPGNPGLCVKLFHDPDPNDAGAASMAVYRARKIAAICGFHLAMPPEFIMPLEEAYDGRNRIKGFLMNRVPPGYMKILELLKPAWRATNDIGLKEIVLLFAKLLGTDLRAVAGKGLSIQDINLGCIMVNPSLERRWVDTDSWSYPGFPCLATTELYAHPDLYPNFQAGNKLVVSKPVHDRFAMTVMFVQIALQGAHPFRMGLHPKYTTLRERASHGVTIFDGGVTYPRVLPPPEILSDALLERIVKILKRKTDDTAFDAALVEFADVLTTCQQCGTDYDSSRANCPKCHEKTVVDMTVLAKLLIETLYKTPGTVLYVQVISKRLHIICHTGGSLNLIIIDDNGRMRTTPTGIAPIKGAKYRFFGDCLAIVRDPYAPAPVPVEIYHVEGSNVRPIPESSTGGLENGQALLDTSEQFLYRTAGNTLMCGSLFGKDTIMEERVAQVHQTQTWFTVDHTTGADREAIFGYDRALRDMQWFVIRGEKDASNFSYHEVKLGALRGGEKLVDFAVYFSKELVLLVRKTGYRGCEFARYSIIGLDGKVIKDEMLGDADNGYDCWEHILGKLFQGDSILHVTPKGIVKQTLANNTYSHLEDTEGVVTITDQLFRFGTKVGVARKDGILAISKK